MNERLRKAFEEITPLSCDRELYESTLGKAEAMREISEDKRRKVKYNATINLENLSADVRSAEVNKSVALNFYNHAQTVEELKHYDIDFTLDSVRVSPMTVNFKAHREIPDERHYLTLNSSIGYVTLRNGSVVAIADGYEKPSFNNETGNGSPNCASGQLVYEKPKFIERWDIDCSFMLEEAVDLNEVVSVTIGGTTIMLD